MHIVKWLILVLILSVSTYIGVLISKKYLNRVKDLKEMKMALNMFNAKMKFTYESIPKIFSEVSERVNPNIGNIFKIASSNMVNRPAGEAWVDALENSNSSFKKEDIETLKGLGNMLGKVDLEGQISEIELIENFLDTQIEKAEEENKKNQKMYKTLGITIGLAMVIILF